MKTCWAFIALVSGVLGLFSVDVEEGLSGPLPRAVLLSGPAPHHSAKRQSTPSGGINNGTIVEDSHIYYSSSFLRGPPAEDLWMDLASMLPSNPNVTRTSLSDESFAITFREIPFSFPYYGHILNSIGIGTHGFLHTGTILHSRLLDFQYIAPLQANFQPLLGNNSDIYCLTTEVGMTIQWSNLVNQDHQNVGSFEFQVSLFPSGDIQFVYRRVPLSLSNINAGNFPVKVGISDAYFLTVYEINGVRFGYIVEYHDVDLTDLPIADNTAVVLSPLRNCITASSPQECSEVTRTTDFQCSWCCELNRCSDGVDRNRGEWVQSGCLLSANSGQVNCENAGAGQTQSRGNCLLGRSCEDCFNIGAGTGSDCRWCASVGRCTFNYVNVRSALEASGCSVANTTTLCPVPAARAPLSGTASVGATVFIIVLAAVVIAILVVGCVLVYGYKRPSSPVGQFMIKYLKMRPKPVEYDIKAERLIDNEEEHV